MQQHAPKPSKILQPTSRGCSTGSLQQKTSTKKSTQQQTTNSFTTSHAPIQKARASIHYIGSAIFYHPEKNKRQHDSSSSSSAANNPTHPSPSGLERFARENGVQATKKGVYTKTAVTLVNTSSNSGTGKVSKIYPTSGLEGADAEILSSTNHKKKWRASLSSSGEHPLATPIFLHNTDKLLLEGLRSYKSKRIRLSLLAGFGTAGR